MSLGEQKSMAERRELQFYKGCSRSGGPREQLGSCREQGTELPAGGITKCLKSHRDGEVWWEELERHARDV